MTLGQSHYDTVI
jgi:hypothetical protein